MKKFGETFLCYLSAAVIATAVSTYPAIAETAPLANAHKRCV